MSVIENVRASGISRGGPNYKLPALVDFLRLSRKANDKWMLVVIYKGKGLLGFSASPQDKFSDFRMIRNSPAAENLEYYLVERSLFNSL